MDCIFNEPDIYRILTNINNDFNPPLSERVDLSIFAEKLFKNAMFFCDYSADGILKGLIALYANDFENKKAYIPLVYTARNFRGKGVASGLLNEVVSFVKSLNGQIRIIGLHTNNITAIRVYTNVGFKIVDVVEGKNYMIWKYDETF